MKLGLFAMPLHDPKRRHYETYEEDLNIIKRGDELGFAESWIGQHFTLPWENMPAPDLFMAKALALGADAVAIGLAALIALNCNKEIPEANYEQEIGVPAGYCRHCHTGKCPVGITTQDPDLEQRLDLEQAANRVANFINATSMELALITRSLGKGDVRSLEPEDLVALTMEASAMAQIPLAGSNKVY